MVLIFRCGVNKFNCGKYNPCGKCSGTVFPSYDGAKYIQCGAGDSCEAVECPEGEVYNSNVETDGKPCKPLA